MILDNLTNSSNYFPLGRGRLISLEPGDFMILFPSDGHMPGVTDGIHATSQKIVIKVLLAP